MSTHDELSAPRVFRAFIGGFSGKSFTVSLSGDTLVYRVSPEAYDGWREERIPIGSVNWAAFRTALDAVNVWRWGAKYRAFGIDGTHWSLALEWDELSLTSGGENCYPDSYGKPARGEPPLSFRRYLRAVERGLGGREFR